MKKIEKISKKWQKISFSSNRKEHYPVLYREVLEYLQPESRKLIIDCTLGMGGHSRLMLEAMPEDGVLIGCDRDCESIELARTNLSSFGDRAKLYHVNHHDIKGLLEKEGIEKVDAFLFDLGISMYQMDASERGFSFLKDGALDMRMDRTAPLSAYDLVNNLSEKELSDIFYNYGDERFSHKIARAVIDERKKKPIATTAHLASVVESVVYAKGGRHPATKVFQALRIAVNNEFESARNGIETAMKYIVPGGRVAVITFHSSEDRMVKNLFKAAKASGEFKLVNKKAIAPTYEEVKENSKSRSAILRVIEKI